MHTSLHFLCPSSPSAPPQDGGSSPHWKGSPEPPPGSVHGSTAPSVPCGTVVPSAEPRQPQVLPSPLSHFTRNINKAAPHPHQTPAQVPPPVPFTRHSHFASSVTSPAQPQASNHSPKGICFPKPPFAVPPAQLCSCVLFSPRPVSPISSLRNTPRQPAPRTPPGS